MMVNAKRIANSKQETLDLVSMREKRQKEELDDLTNKCSQLERSRDQEVTRVYCYWNTLTLLNVENIAGNG
jgi:hypothetical protein